MSGSSTLYDDYNWQSDSISDWLKLEIHSIKNFENLPADFTLFLAHNDLQRVSLEKHKSTNYY